MITLADAREQRRIDRDAKKAAGDNDVSDTDSETNPQITPKMEKFPKMPAPTFSGEGDDLEFKNLVMFIKLLAVYFNYLTDSLAMTSTAAFQHMMTTCFTRSAGLWAMTTYEGFAGTSDQFRTLFINCYLPKNAAEQTGKSLLYGTYQNNKAIRDFNTEFRQKVIMCDMLKFMHTPQMLLIAYTHGINAANKTTIASRVPAFTTFSECADFLENIESSRTNPGSQPRPNSSRNDNRPNNRYDGGQSSNDNYNRFTSTIAGNNGPGRAPISDGRVHGAIYPGPPRDNRRESGNATGFECWNCGERGHRASECTKERKTSERNRGKK